MSANYFFAIRDDIIKILEFIFSIPKVHLYESDSECNQNIKEFVNLESVLATNNLGFDKYGSGFAFTFMIWSEKISVAPIIRKINLVTGDYKFTIEGTGSIQLIFGGIHNDLITHSYMGYLNEKQNIMRRPELTVEELDEYNWKV